MAAPGSIHCVSLVNLELEYYMFPRKNRKSKATTGSKLQEAINIYPEGVMNRAKFLARWIL
jgi:hypothetical protein